MPNWYKINKCRIRNGAFASDDSDGMNGFFIFEIDGKLYKVVASDGMGWKHVSVSHAAPNLRLRTPAWKIMCAVKDLFWEPEDTVIQYHPAHSQYVNCHPGCLHLWQPLNEKLPIPPSIMVGPDEYKKRDK